MAAVMEESASSGLEDFRQLPGGQLAVAGVAVAVISMILEFIALSGFAPSVSGDETVGRSKILRRFDQDHRKNNFHNDDYDDGSSKGGSKTSKLRRERKKKKLLRVLENIEKVEETDKLLYQDYLDSNPYQHQGGNKAGIDVTKVNWPSWNAFLYQSEATNPKKSNFYLGQQSRLKYFIPNSGLPLQQQAVNRRAIQGAKLVPIARPVRPLITRHPTPIIPPRYDVIYPYGVGGNSIVDKLAQNGNFDNVITAAIATYVYNRYVSSTVGNLLNLPSLNEVLTYFGLARSFDGSQGLQRLTHGLDEVLQAIGTNEKERKAQNNGLVSFFQSLDNGLIAIRDAFRESTKENSTLINLMKEVDSALYHISQTNGTTIILHGLDTLIIDLAHAAGINKTDASRESKSRFKRSKQDELEKILLTNLMSVVNSSLADVEEFLAEANGLNVEPVGHSIVDLMKAVDKGLVKLKLTLENETDTSDFFNAISENSVMINLVNEVDAAYNKLALTNLSIDAPDNSTAQNTTFEGESGFHRSSRKGTRQSLITNLMSVVDSSLAEVREFLAKADELNMEPENNSIVALMRAVDKGLVKLKQTFVNQTDTAETVSALSSLTNVITHGLGLVNHALDQTTIYAVGQPDPEPILQSVKDFFVEDDTGQVLGPFDKVNQDSPVVTVLKLADQEVKDVAQYLSTVKNDTNSKDTQQVNEDNAVIKVMKIADEQLIDLFKYWNVVKGAPTTSAPDDTQAEGGFLQFVKRVNKEMTDAQQYIYNITDEASSFIVGNKADKNPPVENINTRFSPITLDEQQQYQDTQSVKITAPTDTTDNTRLVLGAVVSGLALGGIVGLFELITNTGGILRRSDDISLSSKRQKKKKTPQYLEDESKPDSYELLQDLRDYDDYYYNYEEYDYSYNDEYPNNTSKKYHNYTPYSLTEYPNTQDRYQDYTTAFQDKHHQPERTKDESYSQGYYKHPVASAEVYQPMYPVKDYTNHYQYPSDIYADKYQPKYPVRQNTNNLKYPTATNSEAYQQSYPSNQEYPQTNYHSPVHTQQSHYSYSQPSYPNSNAQSLTLYQNMPGYNYMQPISKKQGPMPGPHEQFPEQSDTLSATDIHDRHHLYQVYSLPPEQTHEDANRMDSNQYIYLDQEDVEKMEFDFDFNDADYKIMPFEYKPINYDNYDMDEYGNLDFTKPEPSTVAPRVDILTITTTTTTTTTKKPKAVRKRQKKKYPRRRKRKFHKRYGVPFQRGHYYKRQRRPIKSIRPFYLSPDIIKKRQDGHRYIKSLKSIFDFNGLVALAGLWLVWNAFLVGIVPTTFLQDIINGKKRRKRSDHSATSNYGSIEQFLQESDTYESRQFD